MYGSFDFRQIMSACARERLSGSAISEMTAVIARHGAVSFGSGMPSDDLCARDEIRDAVDAALREPDVWGYYHDGMGETSLRRTIARRMADCGTAPAWVDERSIFLCAGASEGIDLLTEAMADAGSVILTESPTYTDALLTFRRHGAVTVEVASDDDGILPDALDRAFAETRARWLYTIPTFQNPSGRTTTEERRRAVLDIAKRHGAAIVEDDPYREIWFEGELPRTYLALSGDDARVVYCGSFSKTLAPGIRAAWITAPPQIASALHDMRISGGICCATFVHKAVRLCLERPDAEARLASMREALRRRRDVMLELFGELIAPLGIRANRPRGGFFIWCEAGGGVGEGFDSRELARLAVERHGVGIVPGTAFFATEGRSGRRSFRLSYSRVTEEQIRDGMARLARAAREYLS